MIYMYICQGNYFIFDYIGPMKFVYIHFDCYRFKPDNGFNLKVQIYYIQLLSELQFCLDH
jgi:hypothetical protein